MKLQLITSVLVRCILVMSLFLCTVHAEIEFGNIEAPVTITEYGSYTCGYCVRFHKEVLPLIQSFYIETGKVRYIYQEFPIDSAAMQAAVATQCADSKYKYKLHNALYHSVGDWSQSENINLSIIKIAVSLGMDTESFAICLNDPEQLQNVKNAKEEAIFNHDVSVTPTFFINDKVMRGMQEFEEMEFLIENAINQ